MSENHPSPNRVVSQDRNGRLRERTRSEEWADRGAAVTVKESTFKKWNNFNSSNKEGCQGFSIW